MTRRVSTETAEEVESLLGQGLDLWEISRILGLRPDSIAAACVRAKRLDLAERIRAAEREDRKAVRECLHRAA